jgi:tyrosinase
LLWAQWQGVHPGVPFVSIGAGFGLNDPLMEWPDRTPAHVRDHHVLGYTYDVELPGGRVRMADFNDKPPARV